MDFNACSWVKEFPAAITVCDQDGIILEMNEQALLTFDDSNGTLVGTNLLDCHPEPAKSKIIEMLAKGIKNTYTIEKNGVKKLIFQSPWYCCGKYAGFVELAFVIPEELPHFIRA